MTAPRLTTLEARAVAAAVRGEVLALTGDAGTEERIRGALIREILRGDHGPLHWKGLRLNGVRIDGHVDLSYLEWRGALELKHCEISGDVDFSHAKAAGVIFLDDSKLRGVAANNFELEGSLLMRRALVTRGLQGSGMNLTGSLNLDGATFVTPVDQPNRFAVGLYRAKLDDLYMTRCTLIGGLFANGITVRRNVRLSGARARSRADLSLELGADTGSGAAVSLLGASVGGAIYLFSKALATDPPQLHGSLILNRTSCATIRARPVDLAGITATVDHFSFERLEEATPRDWLTFLNRQDVGSQPYRQLAQVAESAGNFTAAREARIALQQRLDLDESNRGWHRVQRVLLRLTVAYGYRPALALWWLLAVSVVAAAILLQFDEFIVKSDAGPKDPRGFGSANEAVTFALDSLVPFADLGVTGDWTAAPRGGLQIAALVLFVILKGLAWALAALSLAATTGLVRKE